MPTVILLDTSLSMRRPASKTNPDTRHALGCAGLEWFIDYLTKSFPLEYVSFLTFSSGCETLVPFTRDHKQLKEKLNDISFHDRTDLYSALSVVIDMVATEWGAFAPCQIIIVTDGSPGVKHQDTLHRKQVLSVPFSCQLSVVCVTTREELVQSTPLSKTSMQRLCETLFITPSEVYVPGGTLTVESIKGAFKQLVKTCFQQFVSVLKCGHLQSRVILTPSPTMHRSSYDIIIDGENSFPRLDQGLGKMHFPREMLVCGFLDSTVIPAPPHYSRHFVLDPELDEVKLEKELSLLSPTLTTPTIEEKSLVSPSEESQKPSFRVLLHGSLKCESKTALLKLGERWYGLLFSQMSATKKANLVLCVLYPNAELPWLGDIAYLGPKTTNVSDPRLQTASTGNANPFPVGPSHMPSFHSPSTLLWAKESVLQTDVSKVIRYSRKLPDKESSLIKELNKLRLVALTYCMPELLDVVCTVLSKEEKASSNPNTQALLKQCVDFLRDNKNPQDKLVIK